MQVKFGEFNAMQNEDIQQIHPDEIAGYIIMRSPASHFKFNVFAVEPLKVYWLVPSVVPPAIFKTRELATEDAAPPAEADPAQLWVCDDAAYSLWVCDDAA